MVKIRLKRREVAELQAMAAVRQRKLELQWNSDRTVDLINPPEWATHELDEMRAKRSQPALRVACPTCGADPGAWCVMGSRPKENWLHDRRRFRAWEEEHGRPIKG